MQKRGFFLLLAATIVLAAVAVFSVLGGNRAATALPQERRALPELAANLGDLAWMRVTHGAMKADFAEIGGHWVVVAKGNYPADTGKVRHLLLGLADLRLVEPKTERRELYGRLDLDDPSEGKSTLVELQNRTGETVAQLVIGKRRHDRLGGGNDAVYIRKPGDDRTWLARGSLDLPGDLTDWLDRRILDIPSSRVASVTLTATDGTALALHRDAPGGKFAVADAPADAKFKGEEALAAPAGALATLNLDDVKPAADLPVPDKDVARAVFATDDGLTLTVRVFSHEGADWAAIAASGSGKAEADATALDAKLSPWVYAIPADRAKLLRTKLADLIEPAKGS